MNPSAIWLTAFAAAKMAGAGKEAALAIADDLMARYRRKFPD